MDTTVHRLEKGERHRHSFRDNNRLTMGESMGEAGLHGPLYIFDQHVTRIEATTGGCRFDLNRLFAFDSATAERGRKTLNPALRDKDRGSVAPRQGATHSPLTQSSPLDEAVGTGRPGDRIGIPCSTANARTVCRSIPINFDI